jgi:uncharacterized Zn ribbon protein
MKFDPDAKECPECKADWQGIPIKEEYRKKYYGGKTHYHRLIGVETYDYDGVSKWRCPDCFAEWNRWTGKLITNEKP